MTYSNESWVEGTPGEHMVAMNTRDNGESLLACRAPLA